MLIVDAHQDLAWNMLTFGRDYTRSAAETRRLEASSETPRLNGDTLLGWPDFQRGKVAVVFATLFAAPLRHRLGEWETLVYEDFRQAQHWYNASLDAYHRLVDDHAGKFRIINTKDDLEDILMCWQEELKDRTREENDHSEVNQEEQPGHPVGLVLLMEGAEAVNQPAELEEWWLRGVRLIGPAWAGTRFCGGTREPGPMTGEGYALLEGMAEWGFGLDISHMDEKAALQALDAYPGQIIASHSNALALLKGSQSNRHLTDRVIHGILARDGVIGIVPFNAFLRAGWRRGDPRQQASLDLVAAQIDYICQMAGDSCHVGIGSDFDGGLGWQDTPPGIDTIADLHKLTTLMGEKGYSKSDIAAIMGGNWLHKLRRLLPESL
jgi:membrane dipeptidase